MRKERLFHKGFGNINSTNLTDANRRGRDSREIPQNIRRHNDNLRLFTGWKGGIWYENGFANPGSHLKKIKENTLRKLSFPREA
jgi:hypothetical protein